MKSRLVLGLLAMVLVLMIAPSSFAQINVQIFNTPSPQEIATNRTAETSDPLSAGSGITVSGSLVASSNLSTTNLILTFPAPVSVGVSNTADTRPANDLIRIVAQTGVFLNATILTRNGNTLTISLIGCSGFVNNTNTGAANGGVIPCGAGGDLIANTNSGSFRLISTRVDANSLSGSGPFNATATLSSSANNFILSTTSFPVISTLGAGIASIAQNVITGTNTGAIVVFTNKNVANATTKILITEGFNFAWRSQADNQRNTTAAATDVGPDQIRLTFTGIPATGTLTLSVSGTSAGLTSPITTNSVIPTGSGATTTFLTINSDNPNGIDQIEVTATITAPTSNPSISNITVTASMFPVSTTTGYATSVTNAAGTTSTQPSTPRFAAAEVGPATIGTVVAASTTLMIPLAEKVSVFDTGVSIANTTSDPFGSNGGGATPTAGTMTLDFFPRTATGAGSTFSLTTSATVRPGLGLATDGTLAAGGTWTVLLSELLTAAGQTGDFVGYVFIRTNFLLAHGAATISDFRTYSLASPVLVLPPPAQTSRNTLGFEALNN